METTPAREIWKAALGELQLQVSKSNYRTWLEKTVGLEFRENSFVVSVPNTFIAEYLDKIQRSRIEKTLIHLTSATEIRVSFQVNGQRKDSLNLQSAEFGLFSSTASSHSNFNPKYVFDSFIVGDSNRLAYTAAQGVAANPGKTYNPLYIYGGIGLGKTHLLYAIAHVAQAKKIPVICISAEQFTNEFIGAVRQNKLEDFHHRYRNAGMLLIDDIQFISGKRQTEECFFHTFNALHNSNRQIVITSDQPPKSIPLLDKRLRSRFEWGLLADIQPPDFNTSLAILQAKAKQKELSIDPAVIEFLARQGKQNIRELEGLLNRVIAFARLFNTLPTVDLAAQAIKSIGDKTTTADFTTPEMVINAVARSFNIAPEIIKSARRDKETSLVRRVAMYMLRQETNFSLAQIGTLLGDRDPATVTNACKKIAADLKTNKFLKQKIADIQKILNLQSDSPHR